MKNHFLVLGNDKDENNWKWFKKEEIQFLTIGVQFLLKTVLYICVNVRINFDKKEVVFYMQEIR